jgi:hypothetical protein
VAQSWQPPIKELALGIANQRGWGDQWAIIDQLIQHESSWRVGNVNPRSGACGLGQALPCSKMGAAFNDPRGEIEWAYDYISNRYGSPAQAWSFWNCRGYCTSKIGTTFKDTDWY